jgi:hypothetical protein
MIERFKIKAESFLKENIRAFIIDTNNTWYSCDIVLVGETYLTICNFEGEDIGINKRIFWSDIVRLEEWKRK